MDKLIEKEFVKNFINSNKQERILFELFSKKKRINAIMRFSHELEGLLNNKHILKKTNTLINDGLINTILNNIKSAYVLSFDFQEGKKMNVEDAFIYAINCYGPIIICCGNYAVIKSEYEYGSATFYVLKN